MKRLLFLLLAFRILGAQELATSQAYQDTACLDLKEIRQKFLEADFAEVEKAWQGPRKANRTLSAECAHEQGKYLGVLNLFLHQDTSMAEGYFLRVLRFRPMTDLWAFGLPLDLQAFWDKTQDQYLEAHGISRPRELVWSTSWLPPVIYPISLDPIVRKKQTLYHALRLKYARAVDNETYFTILKNLDSLSDPVSIPFRSEVKLRAGMSIQEVHAELDKFSVPFGSQIITEYELAFWIDRIYRKVREQEKALAKKKGPVPEEPVKPKINLKKRPLR